MKKYLLTLIIILASVLRLYQLGAVPFSLYWDETSLGYNAYSILKTGHDEHGKFLPFTNFAAFGDYKPPLYIYATVPSIAIFGLTEFAVRFPSALFGVLTVLLTYFLTKKLLNSENVALIATFFMAISPWHLQFSRGAFEANLGLFFSTLGIYLFLKFARDNPLWILPSGLSFLAGMFTFTGQRLFVPFIVLLLALEFRTQIKKNVKIVALTAIVCAVIFYPMYKFATGTLEGKLRFDEVNIFRDLDPSNQSIKYRQDDNFAWYSDIIHNRRFFYGFEYLTHYFDAFNPGFLFSYGDVNPRLSTRYTGELYYLDLPLILAGIYYLFATRQKYRYLIIGWLLISPLGPATARETPHALRMIHIIPTYQILAAFGIYQLYLKVKLKRVFALGAAILFGANIFYYLHMYYVHWSINYASYWQYGYKQAVEAVKPLYPEADHIIVTKALGRPYVYFLFYMQYDPVKYFLTANVFRDKFYFLDVKSFDKFEFVNGIEEASSSGKIVYVLQPSHAPDGAKVISTIKEPNGTPVFEISTLNFNK